MREGGLPLDAHERHLPVQLQRAGVQPLQHLEGDMLGHALREPLLGASLAPGELELRDVGELVGDEAQPLPAPAGEAAVEQHASRPRDADRERGQLVRAVLGHGRVFHEAAAEPLARGIDVHARARRQRQPDVAREHLHDALDAAGARSSDDLHAGRGASHTGGRRGRRNAHGAGAEQERGRRDQREARAEAAQLNHPARRTSPRTRSTFAISRRMR